MAFTRSRWVRLLRSIPTIFWTGVAHYGAAYCGAVLPPAQRLTPDPPEWHPERPAAHVPPSAVEARLWSELDPR